ncbi:MAG: dephospho-CoA kinase [Flavobacteriales bacterium]|nr:dephospho-CoA kinase [Flavobacteriales bacterium]
MMRKPLLVGLTGGIGSGKSTIAKVFKALGVPVFNSDAIAKDIINNNREVVKQISAEFGAIYSNGKLDKVKLSGIVFNDKTALEKLNKIIHPKVSEYFEAWIGENKKASILIKEAAILIESGAYQQMDKIILVTASEMIRIQRVIQRDNTSEQKVKDRIKMQLSDKEKMTYVDFTIINDGEKLVIPQVLEVYKRLKR